MHIKVFGPGCSRCQEAENIVTDAVKETGCGAAVEKVFDLKEMMALGIMSTPAVAVDGKVVCAGRVPSKEEVMEWLVAPGSNSAVAGGTPCGCCNKKNAD